MLESLRFYRFSCYLYEENVLIEVCASSIVTEFAQEYQFVINWFWRGGYE
jgi:hypothetical protein